MKRLRYYFRGYVIRVFYCGEYGERRHRPHYHAIIFGLPLSAKNIRLYPCDVSKKGNINYYSPLLNDIWGKGLVRIGSFSSSSAAYVAQYTLKKNKSRDASFLSTRAVKPFIGSSNRVAIGKQFFLDHYQTIYSQGFFRPISGNIKPIRPFPIFNKWLKEIDPVMWFVKVFKKQLSDYLDLHRMKRSDIDSYLAVLDNQFKLRYYKERALLRRLEARC